MAKEDNMYLFTLSSMTEAAYFDSAGILTKSGQMQFWAEFNHLFKLLEEDDEQFKPIKSQKSENKKVTTRKSLKSDRNNHYYYHTPSHNYDRYHWYGKRKLPTPPPKHDNHRRR